jgi:hypothetical protein
MLGRGFTEAAVCRLRSIFVGRMTGERTKLTFAERLLLCWDNNRRFRPGQKRMGFVRGGIEKSPLQPFSVSSP